MQVGPYCIYIYMYTYTYYNMRIDIYEAHLEVEQLLELLGRQTGRFLACLLRVVGKSSQLGREPASIHLRNRMTPTSLLYK